LGAIIALSAAFGAFADGAYADDLPVPGTSEEAHPKGLVPHIALDTTLYGTTPGVRYIEANATVSPFGSIYESGFRFRFSGYLVGYNYIADPSTGALASGNVHQGGLLAGYGIVTPRVNALGLIGVGINTSYNAGVGTTDTGLNGVLSISARPTDKTKAYGQGKYTTITHTYEFQAKLGLKALGEAYIGPEGKLAGLTVPNQPWLSQRSIGVHLSGLPIGPAYFGISAGYIYDNQIGGGAYLSGSAYIAF